MKKLLFKSIFLLFLLVSNAMAEPMPAAQQLKDQMVCHVGNIRPALNHNFSSKSFSCLQRSNRRSVDYNNLADIYADGWFVADINDSDIWLFYK